MNQYTMLSNQDDVISVPKNQVCNVVLLDHHFTVWKQINNWIDQISYFWWIFELYQDACTHSLMEWYCCVNVSLYQCSEHIYHYIYRSINSITYTYSCLAILLGRGIYCSKIHHASSVNIESTEIYYFSRNLLSSWLRRQTGRIMWLTLLTSKHMNLRTAFLKRYVIRVFTWKNK